MIRRGFRTRLNREHREAFLLDDAGDPEPVLTFQCELMLVLQRDFRLLLFRRRLFVKAGSKDQDAIVLRNVASFRNKVEDGFFALEPRPGHHFALQPVVLQMDDETAVAILDMGCWSRVIRDASTCIGKGRNTSPDPREAKALRLKPRIFH
jgi:hypothetical protein